MIKSKQIFFRSEYEGVQTARGGLNMNKTEKCPGASFLTASRLYGYLFAVVLMAIIWVVLLLQLNLLLNGWVLLGSYFLGGLLSMGFLCIAGRPECGKRIVGFRRFIVAAIGFLGVSFLFLGFGLLLIAAFHHGALYGIAVSVFYADVIAFLLWARYKFREKTASRHPENQLNACV